MFVSHDPDLGLLAHGRHEGRAFLDAFAQVVFRPDHGVELAAEIRFELLGSLDQGLDFKVADDEHIDVTTGVVVAAGIGTEYEGEPNALVPFEEHSKLRHESDRACVELTKWEVQRVRGIHSPETERSHTSAFDQPLPR